MGPVRSKPGFLTAELLFPPHSTSSFRQIFAKCRRLLLDSLVSSPLALRLKNLALKALLQIVTKCLGFVNCIFHCVSIHLATVFALL